MLTAFLTGSAHASDLGSIESPLALARSLFPGAERCEPQVRSINSSRAKVISTLLPKSVPYHELGERVVYSVRGQSTPLGLLHVRHETGEWGLIEIAWQLNLDLTVRDFTLLRCRETERNTIESPEFRALLQGKDLKALSQLLDDNGALDTEAISLPANAHRFARTLIASALKSLAANQVGWALTTLKLRMSEAASLGSSNGASTTFHSAVQSEAELTALEQSGFGLIGPALRNSLLLAHRHDESEQLLRSVVYLRVEDQHGSTPVLFTVVDGKISATKPLLALPSIGLQEQIESLRGADVAGLSESKSPFARAALIAITVAVTDKERDEEH